MRRLAGLLLALLVLASAAWFLLDRGGGGSPSEEDERGDPGPTPEPPVLTGRGSPPAEPPPAPVPPPVVAGAPAVADVGAGRWVVRGVVRGLDREGEVRVHAHPVLFGFPRSEHEVSTVPPERERFELDVSPLFAEGRSPSHVEVVVDHPAYLKARTRVDVTEAKGDAPRVLRAEVVLRPANAFTGVVVDEQGAPQPSAHVALFAVEDGMPHFQGVMPLQPADSTTVDEDGRYRLRTADAGAFFVVAASEHACPASRLVERAAGADRELEPLVLPPGFAIEGRVTWQGDGLAGATVHAEARTGAFQLQVGPGFLYWSEGNRVSPERSVNADADGLYRIEALPAVAYIVDVAHVELPGVDNVSPLVQRRLRRDATPPAVGVDLEVQGVPLRVRVLSGGVPLEGAFVQVEAKGSFIHCEADADGAFDVLLAAGAKAKLHARVDGYAPAVVEVPPAQLGTAVEQEVHLEPEAERADLVLVLEGEHAEEVRLVSVTLGPTEAADGHFGPPETLEREDGVFRLPRLLPGHYGVTVRPGQRTWEVAGYFLRDRQTVEVPTHGEVRLVVEPRVGGRLRIAARDEEGVLLQADCVVRDDRGRDLLVTFASQTDTMSMSGGDSLGNLSPSTVDPPLPAGAYTVELRMDGREPRTLDVEVRERETRDVEVVLPVLR